LFKEGVATTAADYPEHLQHVYIQESKDYYIFNPKTEPKATIIWLHGGAFVAGDKSDVYEYAVELAYEGFKVITVNYNRAPKGKFPSIINEIDLIISQLEPEIQGEFILAGDSAGAHLSLQYAIAQLDAAYLSLLNIDELHSQLEINKLILFCGPYNVNRLVNQVEKAPWLYRKIAKDVQKVYISKTTDMSLLNLIDYIPQNLPETFVSDAQNFSFLEDNLQLVEQLKRYNIEHTAIFPEGNTSHEFQFRMSEKPAQKVFKALIEILY
ncbi:MAG TPA: alpha/beta hydrolase, partial [Erysipelothrix sp.]